MGVTPLRQPAALSLVLGMLAAGCAGELENPDLATGAVAGRVANAAAAGGYVYALGSPQTRAPIGADGRFEVRGVPIGSQQLVLVAGYEGGGASVMKARLLPVSVASATRTQAPVQDAAQMPAAGKLVAAVRPPAGATSQGAAFTVLGTTHQNARASQGGLVLGDLPVGAWEITASLAGYRATKQTARVESEGQSVQVEVALEVEDSEEHRGCGAYTGDAGCDNDLHCDGASGHCYPCRSAADCNSVDQCDPESHTCVEGTDSEGALCELADGPLKCAEHVLVPLTASQGYCSRACPGGSECPSGWACVASAEGPRCEVMVQATPSSSCLAMRAAFGAPCSRDSTCTTALHGGTCLRASEEESGYCSAPCTGTQSCADAGLGSGWVCGAGGYCRRTSD